MHKEKNDAGVVDACIIIIGLSGPASVIELQGQLNVPGRLRAGDLPKAASQGRAWRIVLDMVERVDEVGTELQPEPLRDGEVFMQTHIDIGETRGAQARELR